MDIVRYQAKPLIQASYSEHHDEARQAAATRRQVSFLAIHTKKLSSEPDKILGSQWFCQDISYVVLRGHMFEDDITFFHLLDHEVDSG